MNTSEVTKVRIGELMTPQPTTVEASDTMQTVARVFEENDISGVPVIGARGEVIGVISKTDLIRHVLGHESGPSFLFEALDEDEFEGEAMDEIASITVEELMNDDPVTAKKNDTVGAVAAKMIERHVHRVIVVDDSDCPVGIVTTMDLLKVLRV